MEKKPLVLRDVERGEILRFLNQFYPRSVTPALIGLHLDDSGYPVSNDELGFHLHYLAEQGLVTFEIAEAHESEDKTVRIKIVKITKAGMDLLDRRKQGDKGVRL